MAKKSYKAKSASPGPGRLSQILGPDLADQILSDRQEEERILARSAAKDFESTENDPSSMRTSSLRR